MNGLQVKAIREKHNLSQEELAKALGVSIRTVQIWEKGGAIPSTKREILRNLLTGSGTMFSPSGNGNVIQSGIVKGNNNQNADCLSQLDKVTSELRDQRIMFSTQIDRLLSIIEAQNGITNNPK